MCCDVHDFAAKTHIAIVVIVIATPTITTPYYNERLFDIGYILLYGYYTRDFHSTENDTFGVGNQIVGEQCFAVDKIPQTKIIEEV